jgi:hypothetical protein
MNQVPWGVRLIKKYQRANGLSFLRPYYVTVQPTNKVGAGGGCGLT